jgi:NAD(P)-dependent dehydrogenase (short-subunit alcohol dehydrogenase family)
MTQPNTPSNLPATSTSAAPRNWLITGTSSGFGRALTERLLARGDRVVATVRKVDALNDLKAVHGHRLHVMELDVTDGDAIQRVVDAAFATLGRIDVVISNAGYGLLGAAEEVSDAQIRHQLDTNVLGSIRLARAALPHLRKQGGGRLMQLSSMGGHLAFPALSLYHTSKWAIEGFYESLAQEVAPFNIHTTLVEPGSALTGFGSAGLVNAPALDAYDATPVGDTRRMLAAGAFPTPGDAGKMAAAMIASADQTPAPKRLLLGSDAYTLVHAALTDRLTAFEAQRDVAFSTDADADVDGTARSNIPWSSAQ